MGAMAEYLMQTTDGWSALSRWDLEAAKIRNEQHKVKDYMIMSKLAQVIM